MFWQTSWLAVQSRKRWRRRWRSGWKERQEEYLRELRMEILREETGPDNPFTLKKYAELEKLEQKKLSTSINEYLRPKELTAVVGQEKAIKALFAKIASPYPQHVILYGPPGVGKPPSPG